MATGSRTLRTAAWLLGVLLAGCDVETDRVEYAVGESGVATFRNRAPWTLYLGGCAHFEYEKLVDGQWLPQGADVACVWEGNAQPVRPGRAVEDPLRAREPGTWRLRYAVGVGCSATHPLQRCDRVYAVTSPAFEVRASGAGCAVTGCSAQLCVDARLAGEIATTCEWRPEYACLRGARCGPFGPDGACGWEETPELRACVEAAKRSP